MEPEDLVVEAFGVLLTQVRTARRALEDIERNTSRYLGFEFARALAEGPEFGSPPMFRGALMVHVVNINDLAPGNTFGGFLEALLGGVGNFFSNLIGGALGGFLTSFALPRMIRRLENIVENVRQIIELLGVNQPVEKKGATPASTPEAQATSGETILTTLEGIRGTIRDVTALFEAAIAGPEEEGEGEEPSETPISRSGEQLMAILDGVYRVLDRVAHVVDGLVILIPNVIGAIALLIANLGEIRQAILETVQFILRNALVLRGVLLTVIYETVSSAARLAASIVGILGTAIQGVLTSIGAAVQTIVGAVFDALEALTTALQGIVVSLIGWLVTSVFGALQEIGNLPLFQTIHHLIRILPALLPAVFMLISTGNEPLPGEVLRQLSAAHQAAFPQGGGAGGIGGVSVSHEEITIGEPPNISEFLDPLETTITSTMGGLITSLETLAGDLFGAAEGAFTGLAVRFDQAVAGEAEFSRGILDQHVDRIREEAETLADAISAPLEAEMPSTGLEEMTAIADAYQDWLTGGGMEAIMGQIAPHFTSASSEGEPGGPFGLLPGQFDRPRATIDIDRVEIVIEEEETRERTAPISGSILERQRCMTDEEVYDAVRRHLIQLDERAIRMPII